MKSEEVYRLENCSVKIADKLILAPLSVIINKNEFWTITGPSGSGKSSLLQLLAGFFEPATGQIYFDDKPIVPSHLIELRSHLSVVLQEPAFGEMTVINAINEPYHYKLNHKKKKSKKRIKAELKAVGLDYIDLKMPINTLSGGEKQRIALVRALLLDRPILLLDEVTSALDRTLRKQVQTLLLERDMTVISVSHDSTWIENSPHILNLTSVAEEENNVNA